ncbi:hypothetical protein [Chthonobacter albigriseus]|uniref:hypothetical protein n=1 Tax=Chthonobacter albigriseus TaxID=1683161 RepID=UPI0015EE50F4|nr:hypothetical protein [Chthonobacter albigriseus]
MVLRSMLAAGLVAAMVAEAAAAGSVAPGVISSPGSAAAVEIQFRDRYVVERRGPIGPRQAARIARDHGIRDVERVIRRGRTYRVVGVDRVGRIVRMDISRRTGAILAVRRR